MILNKFLWYLAVWQVFHNLGNLNHKVSSLVDGCMATVDAAFDAVVVDDVVPSSTVSAAGSSGDLSSGHSSSAVRRAAIWSKMEVLMDNIMKVLSCGWHSDRDTPTSAFFFYQILINSHE